MFRTEQNVALLSDHIPFKVETNQSIKLIGWNIMKQMKFNERFNFFNNGFNCENESNELYAARLCHEAAQLGVAAKEFEPAFICLQECPETAESYEQFVNAIHQHPMLQYYSTQHLDNGLCSLMTLYDVRTYDIDSTITEKLAVFSLEEGLKQLIFPLVFRHKESQEIILVVNVHANFGKDVNKDVINLYEYALSQGIQHIFFLGDFNRNLVSISDNYSRQDVSSLLDDKHLLSNSLHVNAIDSSSFCSSFSRNKIKDQWIETRDGTISTCPVTISSMIEIGMANKTLSFTKAVSPTLKVMPVDLLKNQQIPNKQPPKPNV